MGMRFSVVDNQMMKALVATLPVHKGLRPQAVQRILKHGSLTFSQEGQSLYVKGAPARLAYVVAWGKVELKGEREKTHFARRGDFIGIEAAEPKGTYQETARVAVKSVLLAIRSEDFKHYFLKYQPVAAFVLKKIGRNFRKETGMGGEDPDDLDPEAWYKALGKKPKPSPA